MDPESEYDTSFSLCRKNWVSWRYGALDYSVDDQNARMEVSYVFISAWQPTSGRYQEEGKCWPMNRANASLSHASRSVQGIQAACQAYPWDPDIFILECRTEAWMGKIPSSEIYSCVHLTNSSTCSWLLHLALGEDASFSPNSALKWSSHFQQRSTFGEQDYCSSCNSFHKTAFWLAWSSHRSQPFGWLTILAAIVGGCILWCCNISERRVSEGAYKYSETGCLLYGRPHFPFYNTRWSLSPPTK